MLENLTDAQLKKMQQLHPVYFPSDDELDQESLESAAKFSGVTVSEYHRKARAIRTEVRARGISFMTMPEDVPNHSEVFASI